MPFDGVGFSVNEYTQKIDAVIDLIGTPERWGKGSFRTPDGRYCLRGAMRIVDETGVLKPVILHAIKEITGKTYINIEGFNDNHSTDHAAILMVLARARENIAAGRLAMPAESPIQVRLLRRSWNCVAALFDRSG